MKLIIKIITIFYILLTISYAQAPPTALVNGPSRGSAQNSTTSPTAPASIAAFKMQGLAATFTPVSTGNVIIIISGTVTSATVTAGDGIKYQISYGTGGVPANAANLTGTQVGNIQQYMNVNTVVAADVAVPFSVQAVVNGLVPGTAYWFDLAAQSIATVSSGKLTAVTVTILEF
jgi:hypothetical protein